MSGVIVMRAGTTMTVSWRLLTLLEARGFITGYTVTYTVSTHARQRQTNMVTTGPDMSFVTIEDLDANAAYNVSVQASNNAGTSEPYLTSALPLAMTFVPPASMTSVPPPGERECISVLAFTAC